MLSSVHGGEEIIESLLFACDESKIQYKIRRENKKVYITTILQRKLWTEAF